MRAIRMLAGLLVAGTAIPCLTPAARAEAPATRPAASADAPARPGSPEQVLQELLKDVIERSLELEGENAKLKARLRDRSRQPRVVLSPPAATAPAPTRILPGRDAVPPHWIPQQFNGETFYLIPLK